jgi:hypothetical protein
MFRGSLLLLLLCACGVLQAQSPIAVGARGMLQTAATFGDPRGAGVHLDVATNPWLDVRLRVERARGLADAFEDCGAPNVNCLPRAVAIATTLTTVGVSAPVRVWDRPRLDARLVPTLDLHDLNGGRVYGMGLGLEARWRPLPTRPIDVLAAVAGSRLSRVAIEADAERLDRLLQLSLGVRYHVRQRK